MKFFTLLLLCLSVTIQSKNILQDLKVNFHDGMKHSKWYKTRWVETNAEWKLAKELYDNYILNDLVHDLEPRIPKIIHQIWVGPNPLPKSCEHFAETWKKNHPDWEYKLWRDKDIEEFGLTNKHWYDKTPNYGQKSDIARYEILYRLGGVYVDTDFECLYPFDGLHHCLDFYAGIVAWGKFRLLNALIGSAPNNKILEKCIETMDLDVIHHNDPRINITYTTGPWLLTRCFLDQVQNRGKCVVFPVNYFYPWPWYTKHTTSTRKQIEQWMCPESFAIHHWHESWFNQSFLKCKQDESWFNQYFLKFKQ